MTTRFVQFVVLAFLPAGLTASASAQNLLVNPHFDTSLAGWQANSGGGITVSWDGTRDADGSFTSGSASGIWVGALVTGIYPTVSQCVETTTGVPYLFGGKAFIPSGQATSGSAFFIAIPFPGAGCSGPPPPSAFLPTPAVTALDTWTESTGTIVPFGPSILVSGYLVPNTGGSFQANYDDMIVQASTALGCISDATTLCFMDNRFQVTATFDAGNGLAGQAHVVPAGDSGLLWFFSPSNTEAVVKVLDGCGLGGHFWFFAGGLTDVEVTLAVVDTKTGTHRIYHNPHGTAFPPIQDTSAFSCSP
ncbi:MAG: hypothetical protein WAM82_08945 [Thermoanaerobaculia bacterium]